MSITIVVTMVRVTTTVAVLADIPTTKAIPRDVDSSPLERCTVKSVVEESLSVVARLWLVIGTNVEMGSILEGN